MQLGLGPVHYFKKIRTSVRQTPGDGAGAHRCTSSFKLSLLIPQVPEPPLDVIFYHQYLLLIQGRSRQEITCQANLDPTHTLKPRPVDHLSCEPRPHVGTTPTSTLPVRYTVTCWWKKAIVVFCTSLYLSLCFNDLLISAACADDSISPRSLVVRGSITIRSTAILCVIVFACLTKRAVASFQLLNPPRGI